MRLITAAAVLVLAAGLAWAQDTATPSTTSTNAGSSADPAASSGAASAPGPEQGAAASASADTTQTGPSTSVAAPKGNTPSTEGPSSQAGSQSQSTTGTSSTTASSGAQSANPSSGTTAETPEQLFSKADLAGKLKIINEASAKPTQELGPLYQGAVDYLVGNLSTLRSDSVGQTMAVKAAQLIGQIDYRPAAESVWKLFQFSTTKTVRLTALDTLAIVAKGSSVVVNQMNQWLVGRNLLHLSDSTVDPQLVDGCVRALAALADASSFSVLFATMEAGYTAQVTNDARNGLNLVGGDLGTQLLHVVDSARYPTRLAALDMAMGSKKLKADEKGKIASAALRSALSPSGATSAAPEALASLRFAAVKALGRLEWTPSQSLVLENFNRTAGDYSSGTAKAEQVVASANALADMATHEAAVRLSLYLGLINSQTDKGGSFDQSITRALVEDLGRLGDKVAYDNLYTMRFLNYPDSIKRAAEQALRGLSAQ